jgi:hypothetical protein
MWLRPYSTRIALRGLPNRWMTKGAHGCVVAQPFRFGVFFKRVRKFGRGTFQEPDSEWTPAGALAAAEFLVRTRSAVMIIQPGGVAFGA